MMMRVSLMNLGEGPRVFHNRLGRAVQVPVGEVVEADLSESVIEGIKYPSRAETVLVLGEGEVAPTEADQIMVMLNSMQNDSYEELLQHFLIVAPPSNMTRTRPSLEQIRVIVRTMAEDIVVAHRDGKKIVHDDVDPRDLEDEVRRQEDKDKWREEPQHPLKKEQDRVAAEAGVAHAGLAPQAPERPPARERVPVRASGKRRK